VRVGTDALAGVIPELAAPVCGPATDGRRLADLGFTVADATGQLVSGREMVALGDRGRPSAGDRMFTEMPMSGYAAGNQICQSIEVPGCRQARTGVGQNKDS
jgi:hypothetical protein